MVLFVFVFVSKFLFDIVIWVGVFACLVGCFCLQMALCGMLGFCCLRLFCLLVVEFGWWILFVCLFTVELLLFVIFLVSSVGLCLVVVIVCVV